MSYLTESRAALEAEVIAELAEEGFIFNRKLETLPQFFARALGEPGANLRKPRAQLVEELNIEFGGNPLSHLYYRYTQLLDELDTTLFLFDDEDSYMKTTVEISSAELLNINSVPKVLVAAQADKVILPVAILMTSTYGGTVYATVSGLVAALGPDKATGLQLVSYSATLFTSAANRASITPPVLSAVGDLTAYANQPVILTATSNFTNGNGTAKALIIYDILDV